MATLADLPPDLAAEVRAKLAAAAEDFRRREARLGKEGAAGAWMLERLEVERAGLRALAQLYIDDLYRSSGT